MARQTKFRAEKESGVPVGRIRYRLLLLSQGFLSGEKCHHWQNEKRNTTLILIRFFHHHFPTEFLF